MMLARPSALLRIQEAAAAGAAVSRFASTDNKVFFTKKLHCSPLFSGGKAHQDVRDLQIQPRGAQCQAQAPGIILFFLMFFH